MMVSFNFMLLWSLGDYILQSPLSKITEAGQISLFGSFKASHIDSHLGPGGIRPVEPVKQRSKTRVFLFITSDFFADSSGLLLNYI